nr:hypothetical protein [Desulfobacteraceae bacterium]
AVSAINGAITGVTAKLTTLVAGDAVDAAHAVANGDEIGFTVNSVQVNYTADTVTADPDTGLTDTDQGTFAKHLTEAINNALTAYNSDSTHQPPIKIVAQVGDGTNGGAADSLVLSNENAGDESRIIIGDITVKDAGGTAKANLTGLTAGTFTADASHNTGQITLFSDQTFTVEAGTNDSYLAQLGMASGTATAEHIGENVTGAGVNTDLSFDLNGQNINVSVTAGWSADQVAAEVVGQINAAKDTTGVEADYVNGAIRFRNNATGSNAAIQVTNFVTTPAGSAIFGFGNFTAQASSVSSDTTNDGQFTYSYQNGGVDASLQGLKYADELQTDGGSFNIWLYNSDGSLSLSQPVTVSMERARTLDDVANAINAAVVNAGGQAGWLHASVVQNRLVLDPDAAHQLAFANDTSHFLQAAGINTFFTGYSAGSLGVNSVVADNLNLLAAGKVGDNGEIFTGNNENALQIANIQSDENVRFTGGTVSTLDGFYNSLVTGIGTNSQAISTSYDYNSQVATQLDQLRDATSGVSLDEEMANLIKFQQAYSAAAKLINTSNDMLQSLLATIS